MPTRIAITNLQARTIDILNTIRANASEQYQSLVPAVTQATDIPAVGDILYGYPAMANEFIASLMNRIAFVAIRSAQFNNPYVDLKKGYLTTGETVEEVFVNLTKAVEFSAEKGEAREFKRTIPDVRTAFHIMNWRVMYPITIQREDLRQAFTSLAGVEQLIMTIIQTVYTSANYDEYLLFKYLIIKAVAHGKMKAIPFDSSDMKNAAIEFRGTSNQLEFLGTDYNITGVHTRTEKRDQYIFMDAHFNAQYDVNVLASAFNMDKADFMGRLKLIDSFTTFDNARFDIIRENSTQLEEVTAEELALMADVKAVLVDAEWFQVYDNLTTLTEKQVSSGLYWNYFYHTWKTISSSPFSNAIVFVDDGATIALPDDIACNVADKLTNEMGTVLTLVPYYGDPSISSTAYQFVQTESATAAGVAVHRYGAVIIPDDTDAVTLDINLNGTLYRATGVASTLDVGDEVTFTKVT